jgi:hypothetical protein
MNKVKLFDSPIKVLGGSIILVEAILTIVLTTGNLTVNQRSWIIIGMILAVFITIVGSVIMHWINNKAKISTVTHDTEDKKYDYEIFISFPIAGIKDKKEREQVNGFAKNLENELENIGYRKIFNASMHFSHDHEHQPPKIACETDFNALDKSKNFLLLYPERIATSALIELGYALGGQKKIIMCSKSIHTLPFLARGLSKAYRNVNFLEYEDNNHLINMLTENHKSYFR